MAAFSAGDFIQVSTGNAIQCHFVRVGGRFVHYRRAGSGPAVIILHQTPQSSKTMEPLMRLLAPGCTAIALDTPGFGLSERLPGEVWTMTALSDWLAGTLDALGIARAAFCGQHTGGTIAADFALRWPERAAALAIDGYTVFSAAERDSILPHQRYRFTPAWDGSHLVWAWSRFRDGWMFFPWSVRTQAARRDMDMPSPARIQSWQIMELLRSRENHLAIYPPVFDWDGLAAAQSLRVPALLAGTRDDQLSPHLDRLRDLPPNIELLRLPIGARDDLEAAQAAFVKRHLDTRASVPGAPPATGADAEGRLRSYAAGLAVRAERWRAPGEPLLLLHGAGESGVQALQYAAAIRHDGPVLAIDLPGHGDSHGDSHGDIIAPEAAAGLLAAAMTELDLARYRVWGRGLGAATAVELACIEGKAVASLDLEELRVLDADERGEFAAHYAHPIVPAWDGTHLVTLWNELRDREFFMPWFRRTREAIRKVDPDVDAERLTQRLFAALLCRDWPAAHAVWFDWPVTRLSGVAGPVSFHGASGDGWARDLPALRARVRPPS